MLRAPNPINHLLLELSIIWLWKETCDVECSGLRWPQNKYSCFHQPWAGKAFLVKLKCFVHFYKFTFRLLTETLWRSIDGLDMPSWKYIANLLLYGYFLCCLNFLKICSKWLHEEMIQLLKAPNLINHLLPELSTLWRWKEIFIFECRGSNTTIDWASTRFVIEALKSFSANFSIG